jgi:peptidyl-tRNA hydrolase, PTH2 family
MATKQIIVMRTDLNMRKGKMIAQGSHASMAFLTRKGGFYQSSLEDNRAFHNERMTNQDEAEEWMKNSFTKICVGVNSEEELDEIYQKAKEAGLTAHMVIDSGLTEFNGVPTKTCLAIGPHYSEKIDAITGYLKLL